MTSNESSKPLNLVSKQTINNTTCWVGNSRYNKEITTGQTFLAKIDGDLRSVEVYSNIVSMPGQVIMTIHTYDTQQNLWSLALQTAYLDLKKSDSEKWVSFNFPSFRLDKGKIYGFKLGSHNCYMGIGEAAGSYKNPPFEDGKEWSFVNNSTKGDSFSYFSLAFKIGLAA